MKKQKNIVRRMIKNIIYLLKLIIKNFTNNKIIGNNIFQKHSFEFITKKAIDNVY